MAKYEGECGSCYYLRDMDNDHHMFNGCANDKGHCVYLGNCYYPDENACSHHQSKDSYVPGSGCFITTIICDMLGFDDKCPILETLRGFRNNVMQKDSKYKDILYEYDSVGPEIAKNVRDEEDFELINGLVDFYILPTVNLVREKKYDEAVLKYKTMTKSLENYYGIEYNEKVPTTYDYTKGGHGVKKLGINYE